MNANHKIFATSVSKSIDKAKATGKLNMAIPGLFLLYMDLIEWIDELELGGNTKYNSQRDILKKRLSRLKYRYPDQICNYKTSIGVAGYTPNRKPYNGLTSTDPATVPTVSGVNISLVGEESYTFTYEDFTTNYSDPSGAIPDTVIIYISSTTGAFTFDNRAVSGTFEFNINDVGKLKYTRDSGEAFNTSFSFRVINNLDVVSALVSNSVSGTDNTNEPATIGDHSITVDNGVTTVLTMAMFTATYSDPEGDLIDAIRIDEIHSTNIGTFYLSGTAISEGQVITREDIEAGKFTHKAASSTSIETDSFSFSVRDEGSGIWVN